MRKGSLLIALFLLVSTTLCAQVAINADGSQPDATAMIDVKSTTRGALLPRMTQSQISAISSPANGLIVYNITNNKLYTYVASDSVWKEILYGAGTISKFSCGSSITINHIAGDVAPVTKTVTYSTVTSIPGEPSKCWITSNLGSDHQAASVDDATEASAGWYWQFNHKQGYRNDGSTVTPSWTITGINENSNWSTANDPCSTELGSGWRIPTNTEWYNVETSGGWTNWNGPFTSPLKMHAAGFLDRSDGSLYTRGSYSIYWSSTQYDTTVGWVLAFFSNSISIDFDNKAHGFSVRCLKDN